MFGIKNIVMAGRRSFRTSNLKYFSSNGATISTYRRNLLPPAVDFTSIEGKTLLMDSLQHGTAGGFLKLISYHQTQNELPFCGLATAAVVLNALGIDPKRAWKKPWRWFDEYMLEPSISFKKVRESGVTFQELASVFRWAGAEVQAIHTDESSLETFRHIVLDTSFSDDRHLIASYHRRPLGQSGEGHFSPIGCYHRGKDMVLVLDVARFKYPPHWLPLTVLWKAMDTFDDETSRRRGFMLISRPLSPGTLHTFVTKGHVGKEYMLCLKLQALFLKNEHFNKITYVFVA